MKRNSFFYGGAQLEDCFIIHNFLLRLGDTIRQGEQKNRIRYFINPLTSPGEEVSVFTSPYLSAGAPALGEAKGLISIFFT